METILNSINLHHGDCLSIMADLPECSIDAVVTDPPYELGFMGKSWDASGVAFSPDTWRLVWRVIKPGAHLVAFGAPKNYHRLACAIEDAGFEIRDSLMWVFGSGFPKSHNLDGEWEGYGTALKPAYEPIVLARKKLSEGTVAANVLRWGTGAINIDAARIATDESTKRPTGSVSLGASGGWANPNTRNVIGGSDAGRWPANLCHDGSQDVLDLFPYSKSTGGSGEASQKAALSGTVYEGGYSGKKSWPSAGGLGDEGSAARFYYSPKASKHDRAGSKHPTVKPVNLMRWLVRMVTPPGGTILDPFAGSGTTGAAAHLENFRAILIEREVEYVNDIKNRFSQGLDHAADARP